MAEDDNGFGSLSTCELPDDVDRDGELFIKSIGHQCNDEQNELLPDRDHLLQARIRQLKKGRSTSPADTLADAVLCSMASDFRKAGRSPSRKTKSRRSSFPNVSHDANNMTSSTEQMTSSLPQSLNSTQNQLFLGNLMTSQNVDEVMSSATNFHEVTSSTTCSSSRTSRKSDEEDITSSTPRSNCASQSGDTSNDRWTKLRNFASHLMTSLPDEGAEKSTASENEDDSIDVAQEKITSKIKYTAKATPARNNRRYRKSIRNLASILLVDDVTEMMTYDDEFSPSSDHQQIEDVILPSSTYQGAVSTCMCGLTDHNPTRLERLDPFQHKKILQLVHHRDSFFDSSFKSESSLPAPKNDSSAEVDYDVTSGACPRCGMMTSCDDNLLEKLEELEFDDSLRGINDDDDPEDINLAIDEVYSRKIGVFPSFDTTNTSRSSSDSSDSSARHRKSFVQFKVSHNRDDDASSEEARDETWSFFHKSYMSTAKISLSISSHTDESHKEVELVERPDEVLSNDDSLNLSKDFEPNVKNNVGKSTDASKKIAEEKEADYNVGSHETTSVKDNNPSDGLSLSFQNEQAQQLSHRSKSLKSNSPGEDDSNEAATEQDSGESSSKDSTTHDIDDLPSLNDEKLPLRSTRESLSCSQNSSGEDFHVDDLNTERDYEAADDAFSMPLSFPDEQETTQGELAGVKQKENCNMNLSSNSSESDEFFEALSTPVEEKKSINISEALTSQISLPSRADTSFSDSKLPTDSVKTNPVKKSSVEKTASSESKTVNNKSPEKTEPSDLTFGQVPTLSTSNQNSPRSNSDVSSPRSYQEERYPKYYSGQKMNKSSRENVSLPFQLFASLTNDNKNEHNVERNENIEVSSEQEQGLSQQDDSSSFDEHSFHSDEDGNEGFYQLNSSEPSDSQLCHTKSVSSEDSLDFSQENTTTQSEKSSITSKKSENQSILKSSDNSHKPLNDSKKPSNEASTDKSSEKSLELSGNQTLGKTKQDEKLTTSLKKQTFSKPTNDGHIKQNHTNERYPKYYSGQKFKKFSQPEKSLMPKKSKSQSSTHEVLNSKKEKNKSLSSSSSSSFEKSPTSKEERTEISPTNRADNFAKSAGQESSGSFFEKNLNKSIKEINNETKSKACSVEFLYMFSKEYLDCSSDQNKEKVEAYLTFTENVSSEPTVNKDDTSKVVSRNKETVENSGLQNNRDINPSLPSSDTLKRNAISGNENLHKIQPCTQNKIDFNNTKSSETENSSKEDSKKYCENTAYFETFNESEQSHTTSNDELLQENQPHQTSSKINTNQAAKNQQDTDEPISDRKSSTSSCEESTCTDSLNSTVEKIDLESCEEKNAKQNEKVDGSNPDTKECYEMVLKDVFDSDIFLENPASNSNSDDESEESDNNNKNLNENSDENHFPFEVKKMNFEEVETDSLNSLSSFRQHEKEFEILNFESPEEDDSFNSESRDETSSPGSQVKLPASFEAIFRSDSEDNEVKNAEKQIRHFNKKSNIGKKNNNSNVPMIVVTSDDGMQLRNDDSDDSTISDNEIYRNFESPDTLTFETLNRRNSDPGQTDQTLDYYSKNLHTDEESQQSTYKQCSDSGIREYGSRRFNPSIPSRLIESYCFEDAVPMIPNDEDFVLPHLELDVDGAVATYDDNEKHQDTETSEWTSTDSEAEMAQDRETPRSSKDTPRSATASKVRALEEVVALLKKHVRQREGEIEELAVQLKDSNHTIKTLEKRLNDKKSQEDKESTCSTDKEVLMDRLHQLEVEREDIETKMARSKKEREDAEKATRRAKSDLDLERLKDQKSTETPEKPNEKLSDEAEKSSTTSTTKRKEVDETSSQQKDATSSIHEEEEKMTSQPVTSSKDQHILNLSLDNTIMREKLDRMHEISSENLLLQSDVADYHAELSELRSETKELRAKCYELMEDNRIYKQEIRDLRRYIDLQKANKTGDTRQDLLNKIEYYQMEHSRLLDEVKRLKYRLGDLSPRRSRDASPRHQSPRHQSPKDNNKPGVRFDDVSGEVCDAIAASTASAYAVPRLSSRLSPSAILSIRDLTMERYKSHLRAESTSSLNSDNTEILLKSEMEKQIAAVAGSAGGGGTSDEEIISEPKERHRSSSRCRSPASYRSGFRSLSPRMTSTRTDVKDTARDRYPTLLKRSLPRRAFAPRSPADLRLGYAIKFTRPGGKLSRGTVRYIGHLPTRTDIFIGVEVDGTDGKHTGTFQGTKYFSCPSNKGLFTPFSKVIMAWE